MTDTTAKPGPVLVLAGSPRRDGNSALLARAVCRGVERSGATATLRFLDDHIGHLLRDCRSCRREDGRCAIDDGFETLLLDDFLPAAGVVFCSPIYWYGLSAQTKAFFDRMFCYYAASHPRSPDVLARMAGKRLGLALASEESYAGAALGIVHSLQEYARYTHSELVGVVRGIGNSRGEVASDPSGAIAEAERLGEELLLRRYSDYRIDTPREPRVWPPRAA
jgi:multimeric flavodoxin WrbA